MSLIGSVFAVASVAGPLLGGFLVDNLSWRWVFYVNMPVGALAVVIVVTRLHLHVPTVRHRLDLLGAGLLSGAVAALIMVTTWGGNEYAWGSHTIVGLGILGIALLATFVWWETGAAEPILPLTLFRSRMFSVANAMGFTIGMAMFGAIVFIPLSLKEVPLRTTVGRVTELNAEQAPAAATPDERVLAQGSSAARQASAS